MYEYIGTWAGANQQDPNTQPHNRACIPTRAVGELVYVAGALVVGRRDLAHGLVLVGEVEEPPRVQQQLLGVRGVCCVG